MVGVALTVEPRPVVAALREAGLLAVPAGDNALRLLPPLTATAAELEEATAILGKVLASWPRA
jgi:acetylornithine aminotransferase